MGDPTDPDELVREVIQHVPPLAEYREALARFLRVIRVPNFESVPNAVEAIGRLALTVPWFCGLRDGDIPALPPLEAISVLIRNSPEHHRFYERADQVHTGFSRTYGTFLAIYDHRSNPPPGLEQLRATLLICVWRWRVGSSRSSVVATLCSALRGLERTPDRSLSDDLTAMGNARSPTELATIVTASLQKSHKKLALAWHQHFGPELQGIAHVRGTPGNTSEGLPGTQGVPPSGATQTRKKRRKFSTTVTPRQIPRRVFKLYPGLRHERGEAPEDFTRTDTLATVPERGRGLTCARIALYRATQNIWGQNALRLPQHIESLTPTEAGALGRFLITSLEAALATKEADTARRLARTALLLATAKTPVVIISALLVDVPSAHQPPPDRWEISIRAGCFHQSVIPLADAFVPDSTEVPLLHPANQHFTLRFPENLTRVLRNFVAAGGTLIPSTAGELEQDIKTCLAAASAEIGYHFTMGRTRRSLSCMLQDEGRDMAATMMITGDTSGLSSAPLYYYSPRQRDLQALYARVGTTIFGGDAAPSTPDVADERVGSRLLVTDKTMRQLGRTLGTALHGGYAKRRTPSATARVHNVLVDHIAGMLLITAGHRASNSLFALNRFDFDPAGHVAVFTDKKIDAAHWCRFTAIPTLVATQLDEYLNHLRAIKAFHPSSVGEHIDACLGGHTPLLFQLDESLRVIPLNMPAWRAGLPEAWTRLPLNFGRTYVATRGREFGGNPEALATMLGHYESVGFPFSTDGATEPLLLARQLTPTLDMLAKHAGLMCRRGSSSPASDGDAWEECGPLRDWHSEIAERDAEVKAASRLARMHLRAQFHQHRNDAEALVLGLLASSAPVLAQHLKTKAKAVTPGCAVESLKQEQIESVQDAVLEATADDTVRFIAATNALNRLLKRAVRKLDWSGDVPASVRLFHRPETSPFFPGMLRARMQVELLRAYFIDAPLKAPTPSGIDDRTWLFARCALALVLFAFIDDPAEIDGILSRRASACRSRSFADLLIVQWRDEPMTVAGLRGIAALAVGALVKRYPDGPAPSVAELNAALAHLLPSGSAGTKIHLLQRLCSTVSVSNRIELSGATRTALNNESGSRSIAPSVQQAWLDGDAVPHRERRPIQIELDRTDAPEVSKRTKQKIIGTALQQYKKLLKLFPSMEHDVSLPLTGVTITPANIERSREDLACELDATIERGGIYSVVTALAHWTAHMLRFGTTLERNPAFSTIHNYLTIVGGTLAVLIESIPMAELDDVELSQHFLELIETKTVSVQAVAAREVLHFHRIVATPFELADVDPYDFAEYLRVAPDRVDAHLVLPQERDAAMESLCRRAERGTDSDTATMRLWRQARVLVALLGAAGARVGEPLGMHLYDLQLNGARVLARFVGNRHRRIKTRAGYRVIDITHRLSKSGREYLSRWFDAEHSRLTPPSRHSAFLFQDRDSPKRVTARRALRDAVAHTLAEATGRDHERLHRLRHAAMTESLAWAFMPDDDRRHLPGLTPLAFSTGVNKEVLFPRDLYRQSCVVGQARPRTALISYFHLPWIARARPDAWLRERFDRRHAAAVLGMSVHGADRISQRAKPIAAPLAWLNHVIGPRFAITPESGNSTPEHPEVPHGRLLATRDVGCLLGWAGNGTTPAAAALSLGVTETELRMILAAAEEYARRFGRNFIVAEPLNDKPRGKTRSLTQAQPLYALWDIADEPAESSRDRQDLSAVVAALFARADLHHRDRIALPLDEAKLLHRLLVSIGHPADAIELNLVRNDAFCMVRIRRPGVENRYVGRELRRLLGVVWVRDQISSSERNDR